MCRRIPLYFLGVNFGRKIRQKSSRNSEVADRVSCGAFGTAVVTIIIAIIIFTNHHYCHHDLNNVNNAARARCLNNAALARCLNQIVCDPT